MQFLPLFGWAASRWWPEPRDILSVHGAAVAYALLTVLAFVQAVAGVPLLFGH